MKKKLVLVALALAMFVGATASVSADVLCDTQATTFNQWFYQQFYCRG